MGQEADLEDAEGMRQPPPANDWGWTGELDVEELRTLGPVSLELWRRGGEWVNRRVETIELLDVETVRVHLSIDFRLPAHLPGYIQLGPDCTYFLPLTFLPRRTDLAYFDVRDEHGTSVPILTRQENARLTGTVLITAARRALNRSPAGSDLELDATLTTYLATIPTKPPREGATFVRSVLDPGDRLVFPDPQVARALLADEEFRDLLGLCASCSMIHVPLAAEAGQRRIIKISWLARWAMGAVARDSDALRRPRRRRERAATWLGWRPEARYLISPHVGNAESFHVQISAPDRVEFTEVGMRNSRPAEFIRRLAPGDFPSKSTSVDDPPMDRVGYQQYDGEAGERKHLYIERARTHCAGIIWVRLRVARHGFLRAAMAVSWVVAVLLASFTTRADSIVGASETAAAILLLVPALIAGFLVGPGEHAMTRHLLRGPRLLTAGVGLLALIAVAGMLGIPGPEDGPAEQAPTLLVWLWGAEAALALVLAALLTISYRRPREGREDSTMPPAEHAAPFDASTPSIEGGATGRR